MKIKNVIQKIFENGDAPKLAYFLGYKSTETFRHWMKKDEVPRREIEKFKTFLKENNYVKSTAKRH